MNPSSDPPTPPESASIAAPAALRAEERAELERRFAQTRGRIASAAEQSQREAADIRLLAVSKRQPASYIRAAYELGQHDFGENYAQELAQKAAQLADLRELRFHMIGHLQSNKVRLLVPFVHAVSSVDSPKLVAELSKQAERLRPPERGPIEVMIEVNLAREPQKSGAHPEAVPELAAAVAEAKHLELTGLLCIPPDADEPEASRPYFRALRELGATLGASLGRRVPELSMGMSRDLEVAVAEGSTWVRIGTALFGERGP